MQPPQHSQLHGNTLGGVRGQLGNGVLARVDFAIHELVDFFVQLANRLQPCLCRGAFGFGS